MSSTRFKHQSIAWVAAWAILLGALAPTVSRWLAMGNTSAWSMMTVCVSRVGGPSTLVIKQTRDESPRDMKMDRCLLCVMHADKLGLPPTMAAVMPLLGTLREAVPSLFLRSPSPLPVWTAALARAPPIALTC